jgi:hypothetical protein
LNYIGNKVLFFLIIADENNDGEISLDEFLNIYANVFKNKMTGGFK